MASKNIPESIRTQIFDLVYAKADGHGYAYRNRKDNSDFMNDLVESPEVGGILSQYMEQARVRTYIKDTILNRYTKDLKAKRFGKGSLTDILSDVYGVDAVWVGDSSSNISIFHSEPNEFYVVGKGTVLKWETALRKALEYVVRANNDIKTASIHICLLLAVMNDDMTQADKEQIAEALTRVGVEVFFL